MIALFPCPHKVDCEGSDSPVSNYSSEKPDGPVFIGFASNWNFNITGPGSDPGPGWNFCESLTSEEAAILCAHNNQIDNQLNGGGGGFGGGPGGNTTLYYNQLVNCDAVCPDGSHFTWTITAGSVKATSQVLADRIAASLACNNAYAKRICLPAVTLSTCEGDGFSQTFSVTGSTALTFAVVGGMLPPGLDLTKTGAKTFRITGVPTLAGNYSFDVRATDTSGNSATKTYAMAVLGITNTPTQATVGTPYSFQFTAAGGVALYTYSINSGSLPAGLSMDATGLITGTPTDPTPTSFTVQVQDANSLTCFDPFTIDFNVINCASIIAALVWGPASKSDASVVGTFTGAGANGAFNVNYGGGPNTFGIISVDVVISNTSPSPISIDFELNWSGVSPGIFSGPAMHILSDGFDLEWSNVNLGAPVGPLNWTETAPPWHLIWQPMPDVIPPGLTKTYTFSIVINSGTAVNHPTFAGTIKFVCF